MAETLAVETFLPTLPTNRKKMPFEEFLKLPVGPPNFEYENGKVIAMSSPHSKHQDIVAEILMNIRPYLRENRQGRLWHEIDLFLPPGERCYVPDLVYLSRGRLDLLHTKNGKIYGVPDLVVEVTSKNLRRDRVEKFATYEKCAVPNYWIVHQETLKIEEFHLQNQTYEKISETPKGEIFQPKLFPKLKINLFELMQELDR